MRLGSWQAHFEAFGRSRTLDLKSQSLRGCEFSLTYAPSGLEGVEIYELLGYSGIAKIALVLSDEAIAELRILGVRYAVFVECLFQTFQRDYNAIDLG